MKILPDVLDSEGSADMEGRLEAVVEGYLIEELEKVALLGSDSRSAATAERRVGAAQEVDGRSAAAGGGSWKSSSRRPEARSCERRTCRRGICGGACVLRGGGSMEAGRWERPGKVRVLVWNDGATGVNPRQRWRSIAGEETGGWVDCRGCCLAPHVGAGGRGRQTVSIERLK